jgi:transposase-like protein
MKPNQYQPTLKEKMQQMRIDGEPVSYEWLALQFGVTSGTVFRWIKKNRIPGKSDRNKFDEIYREKIGKL